MKCCCSDSPICQGAVEHTHQGRQPRATEGPASADLHFSLCGSIAVSVLLSEDIESKLQMKHIFVRLDELTLRLVLLNVLKLFKVRGIVLL